MPNLRSPLSPDGGADGVTKMASLKYRVIAALSGTRAVQHPMLTSDHMSEILAERKALLAKIEDAARNGIVADALILSLHASHVEQSDECRRLFAVPSRRNVCRASAARARATCATAAPILSAPRQAVGRTPDSSAPLIVLGGEAQRSFHSRRNFFYDAFY
jgi:hypothetical protein